MIYNFFPVHLETPRNPAWKALGMEAGAGCYPNCRDYPIRSKKNRDRRSAVQSVDAALSASSAALSTAACVAGLTVRRGPSSYSTTTVHLSVALIFVGAFATEPPPVEMVLLLLTLMPG